ncbi:MAG: hypothetical protein GX591_12505 [Planctomycetes bacterium]|nr:hypothetical protein [Planctomycetota bacterium]
MTRSPRTTRRTAGVILLEVVLSLALFAATVTTVAAALGRCHASAGRVELRGRAADLAVTLRSEILLGLIEPAPTDPTAYEDERLEGWTWQLGVETLEEIEQTLRVVATVRHEPTGVMSRLAWLMDDPAGEAEP